VPEMTFTVRWPDGRVEDCYSPSLVVHDHLEAGAHYTVGDFTARAVEALTLASERVRARYGFACTSAAASAERIQQSAAAYPLTGTVAVLSLHPPLPIPEESR